MFTHAVKDEDGTAKVRSYRAKHTQQKQIGCFNHRLRVVTLVADKLKRQWLCIVYFANCVRQLERKLPRPYLVHKVTPILHPYGEVLGSLGHCTNCVNCLKCH